MSSTKEAVAGSVDGYWIRRIAGGALAEGAALEVNGSAYELHGGILRQRQIYSDHQDQTREAFGFKWEKRNTYESPAFRNTVRTWLVERYLQGDPERLSAYVQPGSRLLDAGCGAGNAAMLLFGEALNRTHYLGVDISRAVDVARQRFAEEGLAGEFLQADFTVLPFREPAFDVIFAEGTLHHTDSTRGALESLVPLLVPGGHMMFYVYRKKAPLREFSDDLIRREIQRLDDQEAWDALLPLTRLGQALGELNLSIEVPEEIPYLQIPRGPIDIQRFFYWFIFKAYYRPEMTIEEMNHVNFDWYRPLNAHRHTEHEVREWCGELGLEVRHMNVQEAGITVVAQRPS